MLLPILCIDQDSDIKLEILLMRDISQSVCDSAIENLVLTVLMNCTMMARARACTSVVRKPVEKLENGHLHFLAWGMLILNIDEHFDT